MKLFTFAIIAVMLIGTIATAAEVPTSEGDKAMVFTFSGFDNLGVLPYGGMSLADILPEEEDRDENLEALEGFTGGLGMRYYISDGMAVRSGLTLSMASVTNTCEWDGWTDPKASLTSFGIDVMIEKHMDVPFNSISPYIGVGGNFGMVSLKSEPSVLETPDWLQTTEEKTSITTFGVGAALGFEWAFVDGMTLGAEYKLGFTSLSGKTETETQGTGSPGRGDTSDEWSASLMGFGTSSVLLSVYW